MNLFIQFEKAVSDISLFFVKLRTIDYKNEKKPPLIAHMVNFSNIKWRDIYKFIFQGTCGWTHLSSDKSLEKVKQYLIEELESINESDSTTSLYEILNYTTKLCRVNLQEWKFRFQESIEELWKLMLKANETTPKTTEIFAEQWKELIDMSENNYFIFRSKHEKNTVENWLNIVLDLAREVNLSSKMPLLHHSEEYRIKYKPHYRLVNVDDLELFIEERTR